MSDQTITQLLTKRIAALSVLRSDYWKEATSIVHSILVHVTGVSNHDMTMIEHLANAMSKAEDQSVNLALIVVSYDIASVKLKFNEDKSKWVCSKDRDHWASTGIVHLTKSLAELEENGLKSYMPKKKASKGKGGKKNNKVLTGVPLLASKLSLGIEKLNSDASTIAIAAPFITEMEGMLDRLAVAMAKQGFEELSKDFKLVLSAAIESRKPPVIENIDDVPSMSQTRKQREEVLKSNNDDAEQQAAREVVFKLVDDEAGMEGILYQVTNGTAPFHISINTTDNDPMADEPCFSLTIESAKHMMQRTLIEWCELAKAA